MRLLPIRYILFWLPLFAFFWFIEKRLEPLVTSYGEKRWALATEYKDTETLVLGNSQSLWGIDPAQLPGKAYNFAFVSESLIYSSELGTLYLNKLPKLKTILLGISSFSATNLLNESAETWRQYYYANEFGIEGEENWLTRLDIRNYLSFFLQGNVKAWDFAKRKKPPEIERELALEKNGWLRAPQKVTEKEMLRDAAAWVRDMPNCMKSENRPVNMRALERFIKKTQDHRVQLILFSTPMRREFVDLTGETNFRAAFEPIKGIAKNYGIPFLYHSENFAFPASDFRDSTHLNEKGASKFTKELAVELAKLGSARVTRFP